MIRMTARLAAAIAAATLMTAPLVAEETGSEATAARLAVATFASGCYWCTESDFDKVEGIVETTSGFMGGHTSNPTYEQVGRGGTGHAEVVQLEYDPSKVSYQTLLDYYWRHVDPLDGGGQFCDRGSSYRPVIFTHTDEQRRLAEASKAALAASGRFAEPIAVEIVAASAFTPGPEYHQDYYKKNPLQYRTYRYGCGRDARLKELWGKEATH